MFARSGRLVRHMRARLVHLCLLVIRSDSVHVHDFHRPALACIQSFIDAFCVRARVHVCARLRACARWCAHVCNCVRTLLPAVFTSTRSSMRISASLCARLHASSCVRA